MIASEMPVEKMDIDEDLDNLQIIDNSSIQDSAMPREVEIFRGPQPKSIRKNVIKRVELEELELVNKRYDRVYQVGRDCHDITNVLSADIIKKKYEDGKLVYYITYQFYDCTLNEFMDEENIEKSSLIIDILKGSTDGLMHFHDKGYTHRNIQPDNIVICKNVSKSEYAGLIANISSAKPLKENDKQTVSGNYANYKYSAPELVIYEETDFENDRKAKIEMRKREVTSKVDIFSMGLVYYFAFTNKKYPFKNKKQKPSLYLLDDSDFFKETKFNVPLAIQLIGAMLQYKSEKRPNCRNILNHVLFWNKERQINFLGVVSKLINGKEQKTTKARDSMNADKIFGKYIQWQDYLEPDVKKTVNKLRKQPDDVSGLLRAIKNFPSHYEEKNNEHIRIFVNENYGGYIEMFLRLYPSLLSDIFNYFIKFSSYDTLREFYCDCYLTQVNTEHQCKQKSEFIIYDWEKFEYHKVANII